MGRALLALGLVAVAGCSVVTPGRAVAQPGVTADPPPPTVEPSPVAGVVALSTSATCPVTGDLEGAFASSGQMSVYLQCVLPGLDRWIGATYPEMRKPTAYYFVPTRVRGSDGGCDFDDDALQYCTNSEAVYVGQAAAWRQYRTFGDAAMAVILSHEVTHHFQNELNMPRATRPSEQIRYENQADCGAGAFIAYANTQGWLDPEDDISDLGGSLEAAGRSDGPSRSHGTVPERLAAFQLSFTSRMPQPLAECNRYVPEIPLIAS